MIEDAATWLAAQRDLTIDGQIGLVGISFAGGLSIVAAGRPSLRDRTRFVLSLADTGICLVCCRTRAAGSSPPSVAQANKRPPHDYGLAVLTFGLADRLVAAGAAERVPASYHDISSRIRTLRHEPGNRQTCFARLASWNPHFRSPPERLMRFVNDRDVGALGATARCRTLGLWARPGRRPDPLPLPRPLPPVHLLHGYGLRG